MYRVNSRVKYRDTRLPPPEGVADPPASRCEASRAGGGQELYFNYNKKPPK